MIAEVVFNLPIEQAFHYLVPEGWGASLQPGIRVVAPFGQRRLVGYVTRLHGKSSITHLKELLQTIDDRPWLSSDSLRLAQGLAASYACSLGEACASLLPSSLRIRLRQPDEAVPPQHPTEVPHPLTAEQQRAFNALTAAVHAHQTRTFLLHGVTASGKTEVYLRLIHEVLQQDRSAIVLVPEIALTPQTIDWFRQRFGPTVTLWHSRLTMRQRGESWARLAEGHRSIVVGTRSAVFAPVRRLGLIILDEEHDPSYKQNETPRYHAREIALARSRIAQAVLVLGSATPSVESYYHARSGRYTLLELTERVKGRPLPRVEIVDLREEWAGRRGFPLFSRRLQDALRRTVEHGEQAILLLNRRGFARVAQCSTCGAVVSCRRCAVPLVYHASHRQLACHYCPHQEAPPEMCPSCQKGYLRFRGAGTERIESELHRLFPASAIGRMDRDTTRGRESHRQLFEAVKGHQVSLLVGTQMVAKGFDLPQVTLVGVVSADTSLHLPDFRAGERTFDLLTQVAGRAGRGDRPGEVLIQTFCPSHYAIRAASRQDYQGFYETEIRMRRRLRLPPFSHLIELTLQGSKPQRVQEASHALAEALRACIGRRRIALLGPAPHRIARLRRVYRWRVLLRASSASSMLDVVHRTLGPGRRFQGMPVLIDVDPL